MRKISDNQKIIEKFISPSDVKDKYFFGRECTLAKRLIQEYGIDFLLWVPLPDQRKISSLLWLSDDLGKRYLSSYLLQYKIEKTDLSPKIEQIALFTEKIGKDVIIKKEPKTLIDFINLYVKK